MSHRSAIIIVLVALSTFAHGQPFSSGRTFYPEKLHRDLEEFRMLVHQAHPDPYRYLSKTELDLVFDSVRLAISVPMPVDAFRTAMLPILHAIGDSHCTVELPLTVKRSIEDKAAMIPLTVRIIDGELYADNELKGFRSLPRGARIISVNGIPSQKIIRTLTNTVVCDGENTTYALRKIERDLRWLYYEHIEKPASFEVQFESPGIGVGTVTIFAMSAVDVANSRKPIGTPLLPWTSIWSPDISTMWFGLRTLDEDSLRIADQQLEKFLNGLRNELNRNNATNLVIDLRGAGGKELGVAEQVFGLIAAEPYRLIQNICVRSTSLPDLDKWVTDHHAYYADVKARFPRMEKDCYNLHPEDERLSDLHPDAKAFKGKVYVLCDGYTRDAAAALVMLAKRSGRARVVGEETGTNAFKFTGGRELVARASNSGLQFTVPLMLYTPIGTPSGPVDRGEQPNTTLLPNATGLAKGLDPVKENLLLYIRETQ